MAKLSKIVQSIIDVATQVAPLVGGPATGVLAGLKVIEDLIKAGKGLTTITAADRTALDAELIALQTRVTARAQAFENSLRGTPPPPGG
jgi:hypothetical protein